ncbi:unnamed protein product [Diatraea saccharalis]|uniref:Uncharacterized protein n=1 Tax=Diatraea saccharalis TaxID=40085 RepID=A0A9N9WJS5_9NEOP|nr:unnamed protein product [Diatraea saccharalis]
MYIEIELQERSREETFRLKKIKQNIINKELTYSYANIEKERRRIKCEEEIEEEKEKVTEEEKLDREEANKEDEDSKMNRFVGSAKNWTTEHSMSLILRRKDEDRKCLECLALHVDEIIKSLIQKGTSEKLMFRLCNMFKKSIKSFIGTPQILMKTATLSSIRGDSANSTVKSDPACLYPTNPKEIGKDLKQISAVRTTSSQYHCLTSDDHMKCVLASQSKMNIQKNGRDLKQTCCVRETASEYQNRCLELDPRIKCVSVSLLKSEVNSRMYSIGRNKETLCPACSKKIKSASTFEQKISAKSCFSEKNNGISVWKIQEPSPKCNTTDSSMMTKPCFWYLQEKQYMVGKRLGSMEDIWRETWTSTTDLKFIPGLMLSKSVLKGSSNFKIERSTSAIQILLKPSSLHKSDRQSAHNLRVLNL